VVSLLVPQVSESTVPLKVDMLPPQNTGGSALKFFIFLYPLGRLDFCEYPKSDFRHKIEIHKQEGKP
jgi:hypothetical protein